MWNEETVKHHGVPGGMLPFSAGTDTIYTGLRDVLVTGLLAVDYAQLVHKDAEDFGPTIVFRFTDSHPNTPNAYHFVQLTLWCENKCGVVCIQRAGTLTVFRATKYAHTSSINETGTDPEFPSIGVACVQKVKTLNASNDRYDVLEKIVSFPVLERYYS